MPKFAHIDEVKVGTLLEADGGFTCLRNGEVVEVERHESGELTVPCRDGTHFLDGQLDEGNEYIGFTLAEGQA